MEIFMTERKFGLFLKSIWKRYFVKLKNFRKKLHHLQVGAKLREFSRNHKNLLKIVLLVNARQTTQNRAKKLGIFHTKILESNRTRAKIIFYYIHKKPVWPVVLLHFCFHLQLHPTAPTLGDMCCLVRNCCFKNSWRDASEFFRGHECPVLQAFWRRSITFKCIFHKMLGKVGTLEILPVWPTSQSSILPMVENHDFQEDVFYLTKTCTNHHWNQNNKFQQKQLYLTSLKTKILQFVSLKK